MASLEVVGSHLPNLKEFVDLAGEQAVKEQYCKLSWEFAELYTRSKKALFEKTETPASAAGAV